MLHNVLHVWYHEGLQGDNLSACLLTAGRQVYTKFVYEPQPTERSSAKLNLHTLHHVLAAGLWLFTRHTFQFFRQILSQVIRSQIQI